MGKFCSTRRFSGTEKLFNPTGFNYLSIATIYWASCVASTVDLIINGQKTSSTEVQSGPFILNNVPFINGKGEAVVVTTDAVGRQVTTSVPFYISNTLLKPGLFDYSLSLGKIRETTDLRIFLMENLQVQPMPVMG